MNALLRSEELAKLLLSYLGTLYLGYDWWLFFALLLLPDMGMIGYLISTRAGAFTYNLLHHQGLAIAVGIVGFYFANNDWQLAGLILFGHSAMDRILGYGLKYTDSFKHTHLGWIGSSMQQEPAPAEPV